MNTQMINFVIPKKLLRKIDQAAEEDARSRSELLRELIRRYLEEREERKRDFALIRRSAERVNMSEEEAFKLIEEIRDSLPMNQKKSQ